MSPYCPLLQLQEVYKYICFHELLLPWMCKAQMITGSLSRSSSVFQHAAKVRCQAVLHDALQATWSVFMPRYLAATEDLRMPPVVSQWQEWHSGRFLWTVRYNHMNLHLVCRTGCWEHNGSKSQLPLNLTVLTFIFKVSLTARARSFCMFQRRQKHAMIALAYLCTPCDYIQGKFDLSKSGAK